MGFYFGGDLFTIHNKTKKQLNKTGISTAFRNPPRQLVKITHTTQRHRKRKESLSNLNIISIISCNSSWPETLSSPCGVAVQPGS